MRSEKLESGQFEAITSLGDRTEILVAASWIARRILRLQIRDLMRSKLNTFSAKIEVKQAMMICVDVRNCGC
jgi:hypothetical protein